MHGPLLVHISDFNTAHHAKLLTASQRCILQCMFQCMLCMWRSSRHSLLLTSLLHYSVQRRLTFQWDLWSGRPLESLAVMEAATCRFLLSATAVLASSNPHALRQAEDDDAPCLLTSVPGTLSWMCHLRWCHGIAGRAVSQALVAQLLLIISLAPEHLCSESTIWLHLSALAAH